MSSESGAPSLAREMGLPAITFYGMGGMLGGGIYALVGKVAGEAGMWSWASFVLAMLVAAPTAFTYAALGSRFPRSGGESVFAQEALGSDSLAFMVGWTVVFSGLVSMATLAHGFAGYLRELWPAIPDPAAVSGFFVLLAIINLRGIRLTSRANIVATFIELSGLILVVVAGSIVALEGLGGTGNPVQVAADTAAAPSAGGTAEASPSGILAGIPLLGIVQGATLAFYAFIGFEDMVNVSEEVRDPRRNLPMAIVLALFAVGLTYVAVSTLATLAVSPAVLDESAAPLHQVVKSALPDFPDPVFSGVALFAVGNSALLNFVMASRLTYGMSDGALVPSWLGAVHEGHHTPHRAVIVVGAVALLMALSGTLETLAATTSILLLSVFFLMNLAYLLIRRREDEAHPDVFSVPTVVPILGMALSLGLALFVSWRSTVSAAVVLGVGLVVLVVLRSRSA